MAQGPGPGASQGGGYLETQIMTATPQKLQLMMIEGAIRFVLRAKQLLRKEEFAEFCEAVIRAEEVVCEILAVMKPDPAPDLVRKVASVYLFVYRRLMEANLERSEEKLDDALRVLEEERATWKAVCEKLGADQPAENGATPATAPPAVSPTPAPSAPEASAPADIPAPPPRTMDTYGAAPPRGAAMPSVPTPSMPGMPSTLGSPMASAPPSTPAPTTPPPMPTIGMPTTLGSTYGPPSLGTPSMGMGGAPASNPVPPIPNAAPPIPPIPTTDIDSTPAGGFSFDA